MGHDIEAAVSDLWMLGLVFSRDLADTHACGPECLLPLMPAAWTPQQLTRQPKMAARHVHKADNDKAV